MLPDLLAPGLRVVFCGTAVATTSAERGHYYSGPRNKFWQLLHESGLTPRLLEPEDDASLLTFGIGITDLVKDVAQSHDRSLDFGGAGAMAEHVVEAAPVWVAFNGLTAGRAAAGRLGLADRGQVQLGVQPWNIGESRVFVLPSSSGASARTPYQEKLTWWKRLGDLAR